MLTILIRALEPVKIILATANMAFMGKSVIQPISATGKDPNSAFWKFLRLNMI